MEVLFRLSAVFHCQGGEQVMPLDLKAAMQRRFGEAIAIPSELAGNETLSRMAERGSCRSFEASSVDVDVLRVLCAVALSSPTKSDLQQRDIVIIEDPVLRGEIDALVSGQAWVRDAPSLLIFCGNNRRQRQIHEMREIAFANDHLDAFFNAAVDAGIALSAFVTAAEAVGLGCCPISAIRNEAQAASDLLGLPDHVFPVAGLAVGYPSAAPIVAMRLPIKATVHTDRFSEAGFAEAVDGYDRAREASQPYVAQRSEALHGRAERYGWSEDKARQYGLPERAGFGAYVRRKGFKLD